MKPTVLIPALALMLSALPSMAGAAMSTVPYLGPTPGTTSDSEPNRLTGSNGHRPNDWNMQIAPIEPINPYLSLVPNDMRRAPERKDEGPGFLNVDPFDPNSVVNSFERNRFANPYPYDPIFNPYGQGTSQYAPGGGGNVPMGNGIPYGR